MKKKIVAQCLSIFLVYVERLEYTAYSFVQRFKLWHLVWCMRISAYSIIVGIANKMNVAHAM